MDSKFLSSDDFKLLSAEDLGGDVRVAFFKLVDVAPSAREKLSCEAKAISDVVDDVAGYYVISSNTQKLREAMHIFVDQMIDAVEKSNDRKQD